MTTGEPALPPAYSNASAGHKGRGYRRAARWQPAAHDPFGAPRHGRRITEGRPSSAKRLVGWRRGAREITIFAEQQPRAGRAQRLRRRGRGNDEHSLIESHRFCFPREPHRQL